MYQKSWNGGKEYMVSALFRYFDVDGNGFLQPEELQKVSGIGLSCLSVIFYRLFFHFFTFKIIIIVRPKRNFYFIFFISTLLPFEF